MNKLLAFLLMPFAAHTAVLQSSIEIDTDGSVQYVVKKGELKPQMIALIAEHPRFTNREKIVWDSPEVSWPIDAAYKAKTIDGLINDVAMQLNLKVTYYPNGYAVITQKDVK